MALHCLHLRRAALSLSSSLFHHSVLQRKPISSLRSVSHVLATAAPSTTTFSQFSRPFTSTTSLLLSSRSRSFDPNVDEIGPDTILFEGCDYNHWLITIDFPKDSNLTREQMIEFYVNTVAEVFGSVEEAKKKIYALSTTTYQGFQVECSEETSEKFKSLPQVVFVLPDSFIDPVNKEYGGDKYVNGEIFPRPPPVQYGRRNNRDRRPREQMPYQQGSAGYDNQGAPHSEARNHGQNYGPPPNQNYGPPPQQNYGPQPQQNYGPPPNQSYGPPPNPSYGPPPQQNYGPPPNQNYGPPPNQRYGPPQQQSYSQPPNFQPQQNYSGPGSGERRESPAPSYAQGRTDFQQGNLQRNVPPEQRGFSQETNYGSPQGGSFGQVSGGQRNFSSMRNN